MSGISDEENAAYSAQRKEISLLQRRLQNQIQSTQAQAIQRV